MQPHRPLLCGIIQAAHKSAEFRLIAANIEGLEQIVIGSEHLGPHRLPEFLKHPGIGGETRKIDEAIGISLQVTQFLNGRPQIVT